MKSFSRGGTYSAAGAPEVASFSVEKGNTKFEVKRKTDPTWDCRAANPLFAFGLIGFISDAISGF